MKRVVADRGRRKEEFSRVFWRILPLSDGAPQFERALDQLGVATPMDLEILMSVVQDAIMKAKRSGLPADQLEAFRNWLFEKRLVG